MRRGPGRQVDVDPASEADQPDPLAGGDVIAGLVARRIVPWVRAGDYVTAGQRVGLIRFGSRVDVYLPAGTSSKLLLGQRTIAGETVVAEIGRMEALEGVAQ